MLTRIARIVRMFFVLRTVCVCVCVCVCAVRICHKESMRFWEIRGLQALVDSKRGWVKRVTDLLQMCPLILTSRIVFHGPDVAGIDCKTFTLVSC